MNPNAMQITKITDFSDFSEARYRFYIESGLEFDKLCVTLCFSVPLGVSSHLIALYASFFESIDGEDIYD